MGVRDLGVSGAGRPGLAGMGGCGRVCVDALFEGKLRIRFRFVAD
jgi:hypothetical protein